MDHGLRNASGELDRDDRLVFAELGRIVVSQEPPEEVLRRVVELAKLSLVGVEDVSLTLVEEGRPRSVVFTGRLAVDLDERQYEDGFGPCLDAARTGQTIVVDGQAAGSPYREFVQVAHRAGVRHTVAVGMPLDGRHAAGLNVYVGDAPLTGPLVEEVEAFAGYAAAVVANVAAYARAVSTAAHLQRALDSRAVIEQAKGVIVARDRCSPDEAFSVLERISQHQHIKTRDLAAAVVDAARR